MLLWIVITSCVLSPIPSVGESLIHRILVTHSIETCSDVMVFLFFFNSILNGISAVHCNHIGFILAGNLQKNTCSKFNDVMSKILTCRHYFFLRA